MIKAFEFKCIYKETPVPDSTARRRRGCEVRIPRLGVLFEHKFMDRVRERTKGTNWIFDDDEMDWLNWIDVLGVYNLVRKWSEPVRTGGDPVTSASHTLMRTDQRGSKLSVNRSDQWNDHLRSKWVKNRSRVLRKLETYFVSTLSSDQVNVQASCGWDIFVQRSWSKILPDQSSD